MHLLIITKTLSKRDGQGRYALGLLRELVKNHTATVLTSEMPDEPIEFLSSVEVVKIPYLLSLRNFSAVFKYWLVIFKYHKQVDAVHFFTDLPNYLFLAPKRLLRKRYFITAHGTFSIASLDRGWRKIFLQKIYQKAEKVFCISHFTEKEIKKRVDLNNTVVINNGVDFEKFDRLYQKVKNEVNKSNQPTIITVGAVKPRKGHEYALQAVAFFKGKYSDLKYYIVGDKGSDDYFKLLDKIITENSLQNNVIFFNNISDEELVKLYTQANLFLFTPVNHAGVYFEGFGLVCLEAGVCELPVVGSRDCGVEDAVRDGVTGYLVPQKESQEIAAAIDKILSNKELASQMGMANREFARSLTWEKVAKKYNKYYN